LPRRPCVRHSGRCWRQAPHLGVTFGDAVGHEARGVTHAARSITRNRNGVSRPHRERKIEAAFRAGRDPCWVQQDFHRAKFRASCAPNSITSSPVFLRPTVREYFPSAGFARGADTFRVDGQPRCTANHVYPTHRARVADSTPADEFMLILSAPAFSSRRTFSTARTPPPNGQRNEYLRRPPCSMIGRIRSRWSDVAP